MLIHQIARAVELVAAAGAILSLAYYGLCVYSAAGFLRRQRAASNAGSANASTLPPVSILKPLKGVDPKMYQNLRSHCLQDYPQYEIIFGVSDPNDPVVDTVERLKREFPQRSIQLVRCVESLGTNGKVSSLIQMLAAAHYDHLVVSDSDIRVESDYLRRVISPLDNAKVGLVTCLYRGVAASSLGSRLESIGISTDFCPGVLAARKIEGGIRFGLGSTLAFRRRALEAIGGFESFVDYLADDYEMGSRIAARGMQVHLSDVVVETFLPAYSFSAFVAHQLRWARGVRDSRRLGYIGLLFTFGIFWAVLAVVLSGGGRWAQELLALTLAARLGMAVVAGAGVLRDRQVLPFSVLIPVRDLVALVVWICSFAGHTVAWRGDNFYLRDGKLAPTESELPS